MVFDWGAWRHGDGLTTPQVEALAREWATDPVSFYHPQFVDQENSRPSPDCPDSLWRLGVFFSLSANDRCNYSLSEVHRFHDQIRDWEPLVTSESEAK